MMVVAAGSWGRGEGNLKEGKGQAAPATKIRQEQRSGSGV